jgi:hypothetical protein
MKVCSTFVLENLAKAAIQCRPTLDLSHMGILHELICTSAFERYQLDLSLTFVTSFLDVPSFEEVKSE